jgi:hypothetical protein
VICILPRKRGKKWGIFKETADIEVDRAEHRDLPVNHNTFGMQQTIFESENSDAGAGVGGGISFFDLPVRI